MTEPSMTVPVPPLPKKKSGCAKYAAIGCVGILVLAAIGAVAAYLAFRSFVSGLVQTYTAAAPAALPVMEIGEQEAADVLARVAAFTNALRDGLPGPELDLTSRDINVLIHRHPGWTNMAGKVYVTLEGDQIRGDVSIPLGEFGGMFKGRWLVGSGVFRAGMTVGRLVVFMESLSVNGKSPPSAFMQPLQAKNLAEGAGQQPGQAAVLNKIGAITVSNGVLRIAPKTSP